jgi:hypothetical protein
MALLPWRERKEETGGSGYGGAKWRGGGGGVQPRLMGGGPADSGPAVLRTSGAGNCPNRGGEGPLTRGPHLALGVRGEE